MKMPRRPARNVERAFVPSFLSKVKCESDGKMGMALESVDSTLPHQPIDQKDDTGSVVRTHASNG
jgi:hypothetical protein